MEGKEDKYEQLLAKIDWRAPYPPKGYQYGAGRGAKGFITTAELTTVGPTGAKMTREESDFFSEMERMEERSSKAHKKGRMNDKDEVDKIGSSKKDASAGASPKIKLSLDDLATLERPSASPSYSPLAKKSATADLTSAAGTGTELNTSTVTTVLEPPPPAAPLVVRSARTEEGDAAEEHIFADERVLTPYDMLKGKTSAAQAGLQNVLEMGSTEEQTTWITHARAYREMGMTRRAYQTLVEGCAVTGKKGKRIWEERLRYLSRDNLAGRRRLLEEATTACPTEEELWTQLLDVVPPLECISCLQRAVLACPTSEHLWLRLVHSVPSAHDQRVLLQKALQHTPHLPLLWARLARLESYRTGREVFQAAASRFPSLALIIEAAKYVEWYALSHWAGGSIDDKMVKASAAPVHFSAALRTVDDEVGSLVRTAQRNYLSLSEASSRHGWLSLALSILQSEEKETVAAESGTETREDETAGLGQPALPAAKTTVYVCTAAHMFLSVVDPNHRGIGGNAVPTTWLSDLFALLPAEAATQHEVQCALWYTWVLLLQQYLDDVSNKCRNDNNDAGKSITDGVSSSTLPASAALSLAGVKKSLATLESAIFSAPYAALQTELSWLLTHASRNGSSKKEEVEEENTVAKQKHGIPRSTPAKIEEEEEEEEELAAIAKVVSATAAAPTKATVSPVLSAAAHAHNLPSPLIVIVAATLSLTAHAASVVTVAAKSSSGVPLPSELDAVLEMILVEAPLALSDALYRRGSCRVSLSMIELTLQRDSFAAASISAPVLQAAPSQSESAATTAQPPQQQQQRQRHLSLLSDLRLHVARAKLLAAVGNVAAADHCLLEAINAASLQQANNNSVNHALQEEIWVKLAVLRRSQGQAIDNILQDALRQCPRSPRLWLMLLEEKRRAIDAHQQRLSASLAAAKSSGAVPTAPQPRMADMLRLDDTLRNEVRELRGLCKTAVSVDHCRGVAAVWIFAAQHVEAALLQNIPAARALLIDAASVCAAGVHSVRAQHYTHALTPQQLERQASALAQIGVAQAKLEAQYGTPGQALETVQEVVQKLPKTRDGTFAMLQDNALGELLSLFITLEPPASRGRAAAQVMRQWKSREPLVLCAVAQLYFTAGQYARALDQAIKAVQTSKGSCGDAVGLLWRMADQSVMQPYVRRQLHGIKDVEEESGEDGGTNGEASGELTPEAVQLWVMSVMTSSAAATASSTSGELCTLAKHTPSPSSPAAAAAATANVELVVPKSGPLWIAVAKAEDPTNVTLRGYRRPVVEMLRDVANRTELKEHGSGSASAPLRS